MIAHERLADALTRAWRTFQQTGTCDEGTLPPPVLRSWRRCAAVGLSPEGEFPPESGPLSPAQLSLLNRTRSALEDMYQFIEQPGFAALLADASGAVLAVQGDPSILHEAGQRGLRPGVSLREELVGTNAVDLALREAQPMQTCGAEHFCCCFHHLAIAAAPIFAVGGQALCVLGIVTHARMVHPHTLGLAIAAAQALHTQLHNEQLLAEANDQLAELYAAMESMSEGLMFVGPQGEIRRINSRAADTLGLQRRTVAGQPLEEVLTPPLLVRQALQRREEVAELELRWQRGPETVATMCGLRPVWDRGGRYLGALITLRPARSVQQLVQRVVGAHATFSFHDIIGQSGAMRQALHLSHLAANSSACVMLLGEPGVGREMFAQAIHKGSSRSQGAFVALNCAAVPRALLPAELFGVEGSDERGEPGRPGKLELAYGGVLFLEQVELLPFDLQTSLLRTIEMRRLLRTGGNRAVPVDVRIIATCGPELERQVQEGRFRPDLAARLRAFTVEIPSLRERGDDVLLLANHLLLLLNERLGKQTVLAPEALQALRAYPWPGNVRELELTLERLLHNNEKSVLTLNDLPAAIARAASGPAPRMAGQRLSDTHALSEAAAIQRAAQQANGHMGRTAELLGISRATLWRKMARHGLSRESLEEC
ncbi:MAG: sigma 54-interacting transcriptional regulator [Chloroflexaceae bacterium]|nr:sigma 54-interacting transcriptional regulator [Chloroflexaceae bacterium]